MATSDDTSRSHRPFVDDLRRALADQSGVDAGAVGRLECLLEGRSRFEALVGDPPGGVLGPLPPPFAEVELPTASDHHDQHVEDGHRSGPAAIGARYEDVLGTEARGDRGQFFTPAAIADGLVGWALKGFDPSDEPPRVLDPAVGTGTFLLAAHRRLRDGYPDLDASARLARLIGVDVDAVALQLAGLRLAAADGTAAPEGLSHHHASFFDCAPTGEDGSAVELPPVDAVVGNPPYIRAEGLSPNADHFRRHLVAFGPDGEAPLLDGPDALSRRSDAYVYFITHATRFLRPGGRLAMVLPTKWLMSEYGVGLRRFLRDRYRVHAVIGFDGRAFDALVDTSLLLAERDGAAGTAESLRFVRLGEDEVVASLADGLRDGTPIERGQDVLTSSGSLARYLEAPTALLELFESGPFVRLDACSTVARGTMTGANAFFFVDEMTISRFGIESRFLRPAVKSLRSIDRPVVDTGDVDRSIVAVDQFVADREPADGSDREADIKRALVADGYDGLATYLDHAERSGWHEGRTCRSRSIWFDLGPLRAPAAFVPKLLRERVFVVRNTAGAIPSNAIDGVWPDEGVDPGPLLAVLNASVGKAAMELTGRDEAGLLQLMTYETASLPTLDIGRLSGADAAGLATAGAAYAATPNQTTLAALDETIDELFDLALSGSTIRDQVRSLRRQRIDGTSVASERPA